MSHTDRTNSQIPAHEAEINRLQLEILTLRKEQGSALITLSEYILARLEQLGVKSMFGVPGDFFLRFLDYVEDHPTIQWVGECNELTAVYAADGYARVKRSLGVVVTTFGPGELSTINGLAGSFSEELPILHIVGCMSTSDYKSAMGKYDTLVQCARQVTYSQAILTGKEDAAEKIDKLLVECITQSRPVYLTLPSDLIEAKVSSARLKYPLARLEAENDKGAENVVIQRIYDLVRQVNGEAVVLVDSGIVRHNCKHEVLQFLMETKFPVYVTPVGKTTIDESYERYGGVYFGQFSRDDVKLKVESAKLIISIGAVTGNLSTRNFTRTLPGDRLIQLRYDYTEIANFATYLGVGMKPLLPKLAQRLKEFSGRASQIHVPKLSNNVVNTKGTNQITHAWFWPRLGQWFKCGDVILTETGTANYGILDVRLPAGSTFLAQMLWSSIGWSVGATHGASLALKETVDEGTPSRTILVVGDGSLQVTVQELSIMIRSGVKPIIFVLNNSGYTIERFFNSGKDRKYTEIVNWDWTLLLKVLGDITGEVSRTYQTKSISELDSLLNNKEFGEAKYIQLVEVMMDKLDVPAALRRSIAKL